jgi:hypothetical protein
LQGIAVEDVHVVCRQQRLCVLGADEELKSGSVLSAFQAPPVVPMAFETFGDQT